jgi:hypothetical protein
MISFSFRVEPVPGKPLGLDPVSLAVQSIDSAGQPHDLVRRNSVAHGTPLGVPSDYVSETIPDNASRIRISFQGVGAAEMIRVTELNIISDDVRPTVTDSLCTRP